MGDGNEAYVLLNSLPDAYKEVKNAMKYGRESITTDAIISALRTKELELQVIKKEQPNAEGLFVKGKNKPNQSKGGKQQTNEEHKPKTKLMCNYYKKQGHLMRDCFILDGKKERKRERKKTL